MKKLLSILATFVFVFGLAQNVFALDNHTCNILLTDIASSAQVMANGEDQILPFEKNLEDNTTLGYSKGDAANYVAENAYIALEQAPILGDQTQITFTVHYLNPYAVDGVNYELKSFYYKAGQNLFLITLDKAIKVGQCAAFTVDLGIKAQDVSHMFTINTNFVPPSKCVISGFKFNYDTSTCTTDVPFVDKFFTFNIIKDGVIIASATSNGNGELIFDNGLNTLKLDQNQEYTITEVQYAGYEVAKTLQIVGTEITEGNSSSITFNTGTSATIIFKFYNKKQIVYCPETAWAYGGVCHANMFTSLGNISSNNWGWTNGPLNEGDYTFELYAGAGKSDVNKGLKVGSVYVNYYGGQVTVTYDINSLYQLNETHLWIGSQQLPKNKSGQWINAPGKFPYVAGANNTFTLSGFSGPIYVAAHAVVGIPVE